MSVFAGRRHDTNEETTMTAELLSIANFSKNVSDNKCKYPDVSIGDNYSKECSTSVCVYLYWTGLDALGSGRLGGFGQVRI